MKARNFLLSTTFILMLLCVGACDNKEDTTVKPGIVTKSAAKEIKAFTFDALNLAVAGVIDASAKTITVSITSNADLTTLVPKISISEKATVSPASRVAQDFTKPVTYTVTAEDGSTQAYIATVTKTALCRIASITGTSQTGTNKTTYELDSQKHLTQQKIEYFNKQGTITQSQTATYAYDKDGFLEGPKTTFFYSVPYDFNVKERNVKYNYKDGKLAKMETITSFVGASVSTQSNVNEYEYDAKGDITKRVFKGSDGTEETTTIVNGVVTGFVSNKFVNELDTQGHVTKRTSIDGANYTVYQYNAAGQNTSFENYVKGKKTSRTVYTYVTTKMNTPYNPLGFKGQLTSIPSPYGSNGTAEKYTSYTIDVNGVETKSSELTYTYKTNALGNVSERIDTSFFSFSNTTLTTNYVYNYEGCQ